MAYEFHIERSPEQRPIDLDEWKDALRRLDGVRPSRSAPSATNPRTRERITLPARDGDAEVFIPKFAEWIRVFSWSPRGSITFKAEPSTDTGAPVMRIAFELAEALDAHIVGDEGETYERADFLG